VSGAWIGNFTTRPVSALLHRGDAILPRLWLVYRSSKLACADGEACARPLPNRLVKTGLVLATILVAVALDFDFLAPLFIDS
jgi:mercuric ion transport protein